jgi:hypothetical protein
MADLRGMARTALNEKWPLRVTTPQVALQVAFLTALGKSVTTAKGFSPPETISASPRLMLLRDGTLSTGGGPPLEQVLLEHPPTLTLELITARLAAIAPRDADVQAAADIIRDPRPSFRQPIREQ